MEKLFRDIGVKLPKEIFNVTWEIAHQRNGIDNKVSIEDFRRTLQEMTSGMIDYQE